MAAQISKTIARPVLYSCSQRSIDMRWNHKSIMSTQLVSTLLRKSLHKTNINFHLMYSQKVSIPLPGNVRDINAIETARFSPQRNRDITGNMISAQSASEVPASTSFSTSNVSDNGQSIDSYDCTGTVSLNSAMQTNVPEPFTTKKKAPVHLNMPGGEWSRSDKYIADDMQTALFTNKPDFQEHSSNSGKGIYTFRISQATELHNRVHWWSASQTRLFSTSSGQSDKKDVPPPGLGDSNIKLTRMEKLSRAVKEYGSTVIIFHTSISLLSLGICYLAVTSGLDLKWLQSYLPVEIPEEVGGFVIAYAVHKAMSPLRIGTTLVCAPIIVRYLRQKGFLKQPRTLKYYEKPEVRPKN